MNEIERLEVITHIKKEQILRCKFRTVEYEGNVIFVDIVDGLLPFVEDTIALPSLMKLVYEKDHNGSVGETSEIALFRN